MKTIVKNSQILLFISIISFPLFATIYSLTCSEENSENRKLRDFPHFSIDEFNTFAARFDKYFNQNFSPRTKLFKCYSLFKIRVLKVSPDPSNVILGKDGWFFLGDGNGG